MWSKQDSDAGLEKAGGRKHVITDLSATLQWGRNWWFVCDLMWAQTTTVVGSVKVELWSVMDKSRTLLFFSRQFVARCPLNKFGCFKFLFSFIYWLLLYIFCYIVYKYFYGNTFEHLIYVRQYTSPLTGKNPLKFMDYKPPPQTCNSTMSLLNKLNEFFASFEAHNSTPAQKYPPAWGEHSKN